MSLLRNSMASTVRHPRTVVGLDASGSKMTLLVVDGRKPGIAVGMSYDELAAEMLQLGCAEALNLDGGGSTSMAMEDPVTHERTLINASSDNPAGRSVASSLAVFARPR